MVITGIKGWTFTQRATVSAPISSGVKNQLNYLYCSPRPLCSWSSTDQTAPPTAAGILSEDENWERIDHFLGRVVPVATACHPHDPYTPPGYRGVTRVLGTVAGGG
jgi:hypothetical protein